MLHLLRSLTPNQCSAVIASYLGWTLDAFDFFILVSKKPREVELRGLVSPVPGLAFVAMACIASAASRF
jgi:hypothetical protein